MRKDWQLYGRLLAVQLRSQMQYRVSFWLELLGTGAITAAEFLALAVSFWRFEQIGGWSLGEVAFLYGLVNIAFAIMDMLFAGFDPPHFGQSVRRGSFDQLLLRPINITLQVLGSALGLHRLARILTGGAIFWFALSRLDVVWTVGKLLYLPLVVAGMVCFFGSLFIIGATISFWTIESLEVMNIFIYGGSLLVSYPIHIYPRALRRFFIYIVPAALLNYYPALYFLERPDPLGMPALAPFLAPLVGLLFLLGALRFWYFGLGHYQSTGS